MTQTDDGTAFTSTEKYYAEYRPGYGEETIQHLREKFALNGKGCALDLGCGAGQIAIPLSEHVGEVIGMDPNKAMLQEARAKAEAAGRTNIEWRVGSDADLVENLGPLRLTTMGRAFHWMDQERTLERLYRMTVPGGGIALLDDTEWFAHGEQAWQDEVYNVAARYISELPERTGPVEKYDDPWNELVADFAFVDIEKYVSEFEREWTPDEVVGYLFSLSFCSPSTVGEDIHEFEADVRTVLADYDRDTFIQNAERSIITGKKPESDA